MKKLMIIISVVVVIGLIAWGAWFFISSRNSSPAAISTNPVGLLPPVQSQAQNGTTASVQGVSSPQDPQVANDFLGAIQNANQISLGGTVEVSPYALQIWGDTNKGGEALLEYGSSTGWSLVSLGGGEWTVLSLIQEGVPVTTAQQLVAGLGQTGASTPATSSVAIPAGDTISIGTSHGVVTMNNFYSKAVYIDSNEQTVVIQQTPNYGIFYNISGSSFVITLLSAPLEAAQQAAESAFISNLGISQQDACKLTVYENVPASVSSQYVGQSSSLSFCGGLPAPW
jgi:hypothetical protein